MLHRRALTIAVSAAACVSAAAAYMLTSGPQEVAVPTPDASAAARCRALHEELPHTVSGLALHDLKPRSDLTAGWGDPAIVLRCGVPRPEKMNDAEADGVSVDGVDWLLEPLGDGSFRFTTTYRTAYVEVTLPQKYAGDVGPLTDLAGPVGRTIPSVL